MADINENNGGYQQNDYPCLGKYYDSVYIHDNTVLDDSAKLTAKAGKGGDKFAGKSDISVVAVNEAITNTKNVQTFCIGLHV
jgi:hypothetical protein